jgi:hypothetical protein
VLIDALHPALENRVEPLGGVDVNVTARPFFGAVLDEIVASEVLVERGGWLNSDSPISGKSA